MQIFAIRSVPDGQVVWPGLTGGVHPMPQVQAFASLAMVAVLFIFVAATFRAPLPKPLPNYLSGLNFYGYSSLASMPISLFSATVFSEAMWQRCWATVDKKCATCAGHPHLNVCGTCCSQLLYAAKTGIRCKATRLKQAVVHVACADVCISQRIRHGRHHFDEKLLCMPLSRTVL